MRILFDGQQLNTVVADTDKKGMKYILTDDVDKGKPKVAHCKEIVVSMEHGNMSMIPFAICVLHDGRMRLVNLPRCAEVELKDNISDLPTEEPSSIIVPSGVIGKPN